MHDTFLKAIPLLLKIEEAGFEAYFVGGSVRDFLLEKEISDVDIATSATPNEVKGIFQKTADVGIEHGTIVVLYNGIPYEVTTFRSEAEYIDFRRPSEVQFIRSLTEDLKRRDFTMNAIALDSRGNFFDPFKGRQAIVDKVIQTVGKAEDRFQEDALRMMRAVRFYSQLGFKIEDTTYEALRNSASLLQKISVERKLAEFEKLLAGKNRKKALLVLEDTNLLTYLPGLDKYKDTIKRFAAYELNHLSVEEMWGLMVNEMNIKNPDQFLKAWKLSSKKIKKILQLSYWLTNRKASGWTKKTIYEAGKELLESTEKIFNVQQDHEIRENIDLLLSTYHELPIKQRSELQVTGTDLQEWFQRTPGPWIKEKLEYIESAILYREVENGKESIKEWLLRCNQN